MSEVGQQDNPSFLFEATGLSEATIELSKATGISSMNAVGSSNASINLIAVASLDLVTGGTSEATGFFRINDEPNVFANCLSEGSSSASLNPKLALDFPMITHGSSSASINFSTASNAELKKLRVIFEALPVVTNTRYRQYKFRCLLDDVAVPIQGFTFTRSSLASTFTAQLADFTKKADIIGGGSFKFEIAEVKLGVTTWRTIFDTGQLDSSSYNLSWADTSPSDTFSFSILSDLSNKLNKTPLRDLVIFDGTRTKVESSSYEPFYDTLGRKYAVELKNITGLKLHDIFQEIFVNRCGFSNFVTNIEDVPIRRADFPFQRTFWESLKGYLGMYRIAIKQVGTKVYIINKANALPAGFPAPATMASTSYASVSRNRRNSRVEALRLHYVTTETENLYRVERLEQITNPIGDDGYFEEYIETTYFDWKSVEFPDLIVKTTIDRHRRSMYAFYGAIEVSRDEERYTYDSAGRVTRSEKTKDLYMPFSTTQLELDISGGYHLAEVEKEITNILYSSHPFIPFAVYQRQIKTEISGKVAVDATQQYLNEDFQQAMIEAHRAGNLKDGMAIAQGKLKTIITNNRIQKNGTVKSETQIIDHLRKDIPVTLPATEVAGDIVLSSGGEATRKLLVFENDIDIKSGLLIEDFHVGELPLYIALPLARKELLYRKYKAGSLSATLIGLNLDIEDGTPLALSYPTRAGEAVENMMIDSTTISANSLGTPEQTVTMSVQGEPL